MNSRFVCISLLVLIFVCWTCDVEARWGGGRSSGRSSYSSGGSSYSGGSRSSWSGSSRSRSSYGGSYGTTISRTRRYYPGHGYGYYRGTTFVHTGSGGFFGGGGGSDGSGDPSSTIGFVLILLGCMYSSIGSSILPAAYTRPKNKVVVRNEYQDTTYTPAFSPYAQQQFVQQPYVQPTPQELVMVKPKSTRTDTDSKVQSDAVKTSVQKNNSEVSVEPKMPTVDAPKAKTQKATTNVSVAQPQKQAKMNFLDPGMDFLKH